MITVCPLWSALGAKCCTDTILVVRREVYRTFIIAIEYTLCCILSSTPRTRTAMAPFIDKIDVWIESWKNSKREASEERYSSVPMVRVRR